MRYYPKDNSFFPGGVVSEEMASVKAPVHPRGLPQVLFIEDEERFLREAQMTPEEAALEMRQAFDHLRIIREQFAARKEQLQEKIPLQQKSLDVVRHLQARAEEEQDTHLRFELSGGVFAKVGEKREFFFFFSSFSLLTDPSTTQGARAALGKGCAVAGCQCDAGVLAGGGGPVPLQIHCGLQGIACHYRGGCTAH